jgi:hypothetical protein
MMQSEKNVAMAAAVAFKSELTTSSDVGMNVTQRRIRHIIKM